MEFSIATLLANFADDKLVAPKVLEKKLGCHEQASLRRLQIALDALEKIGILEKDKGRYRRVPQEDVVEAKLRCSSKGFCFAIQDREGAEDIYIRECHLSTAWNSDRVLVKIIKEGSRRRSPEGEVQLVLERANPSVLARLKQTNAGYRAVPLDDRLLFELDLENSSNNLADAIDYLVHVSVQRYPLGPYPPIGRVVQVLGSDAEAANDLDLVCCKHDLPREFPEIALEAAKSIPNKLRKTDLKKRLDLRDVLTIGLLSGNTLTPETETIGSLNRSFQNSVEHAISLEKTKAGNWVLGIHIADASYYIPNFESPLDRIARKRGSSVFLGETIIPILPESLYTQRLALVPAEDRLTISVLVTLNAKGEIEEFEIQPSAIQVDSQVTYEQAQAILERPEGENPGADLPEEVVEMIEQMAELSALLRTLRQQRGGIELDLPYTYCHYDDEGPLGVTISSAMLNTQAMVAELMILTNEIIASHLQALSLPAIYRVQPPPDLEDVQEVIKLASNLGIELHLEDEEVVRSPEFQRFTQQISQTHAQKVLTYLLQATLKPAVYSTKPGSHFGLALESGYTHSTSPLQRYADLLVQRVLKAVFEEGRDRRTSRAKEAVNLRHSSCHGKISWNVLPPELHHELEAELAAVVVHLSERDKLAQEAEADLEGLKKAAAMKDRTGETFQGVITGVQSYGFFVEIEMGTQGPAPSRLEGLVHVSSLKDDWYEYRSRQQTLVGRKNRKQYRLGDRVEVQVKSVDYYRQQIDLVAVGGGSEALNLDDDDVPPYGFDDEPSPVRYRRGSDR